MQRSWMYAKDAAVTAINSRAGGPNGPPVNLKARMQPFDNATSLPMGEGVWAVHPKSTETGFYRRVRTDVTIQKNNFITRK